MDANAFALVRLVILIVLPILPAFLLFKALPSKGELRGPFHGMELKLGGAFAGYFVIIVLLLFNWNKINPTASHEVWEVSGQLNDQSGKPIELLPNEDFRLSPPTFRNDGGGRFEVSFYTDPGPAGQLIEFPTLTVSLDGYDSVTVPLGPDGASMQAKRDESDQIITLKPIDLDRVVPPPYNPAGVPPAPIGAAN